MFFGMGRLAPRWIGGGWKEVPDSGTSAGPYETHQIILLTRNSQSSIRIVERLNDEGFESALRLIDFRIVCLRS